MKMRIILVLIFFLSSHIFADVHIIQSYHMSSYDREIINLYDRIPKSDQTTKKIDIISEYFLGRPYLLGPTGEGMTGEFNQLPVYRTDIFDCLTFTETVLALAHANELTQFQKKLLAIRYHGTQPQYVTRNHFVSVDWNPNAEHLGYLRDITSTFNHYRTITILIDKPHWYQQKTSSDLFLLKPITFQQVAAKLQKFHDLAGQVAVEHSQLDYLPLRALYSAQGSKLHPNIQLFNQIPNGSIIEIVNLNHPDNPITHIGFAIRTDQGLMLRTASLRFHQVIDVPLIQYLQGYWRDNTSSLNKGIHIEKVLK